MKSFSEIKKGDSVYLLKIVCSELPKESLFKELKVEAIECVENSLHYKVILDDGTVICPTGLFPYHSVVKESHNKQYSLINPLTEDVYATSKEECIRITKNSVEINTRKLDNMMCICETQIEKLNKCSSILEELKNNIPVEIKAEVVVV